MIDYAEIPSQYEKIFEGQIVLMEDSLEETDAVCSIVANPLAKRPLYGCSIKWGPDVCIIYATYPGTDGVRSTTYKTVVRHGIQSCIGK